MKRRRRRRLRRQSEQSEAPAASFGSSSTSSFAAKHCSVGAGERFNWPQRAQATFTCRRRSRIGRRQVDLRWRTFGASFVCAVDIPAGAGCRRVINAPPPQPHGSESKVAALASQPKTGLTTTTTAPVEWESSATLAAAQTNWTSRTGQASERASVQS